MINDLIIQIEVIMRDYGAIGVFIAAFLEEVIAPIPSSLIAMLAGFFLIPVDYSWIQALPTLLLKVAFPMSVGITVGSLIFYAIAYLGGKPVILKYGKWFGLNWLSIEKMENKFAKSKIDEIILFILRVIPFVPSVVISVFCGLIRYPIKTFILLTLAGSFFRSVIMAVIGWQARNIYFQFVHIFNELKILILILILIVLLFYFWKRIKFKFLQKT